LAALRVRPAFFWLTGCTFTAAFFAGKSRLRVCFLDGFFAAFFFEVNFLPAVLFAFVRFLLLFFLAAIAAV
jgi:hypothetical protein